jgi:hypothetical protein
MVKNKKVDRVTDIIRPLFHLPSKIQFDMENHLYESHKEELLLHLPLKGKGYNMEYRIQFVMKFIKRRMESEEIKKKLLHESDVASLWLR